MSDGFRPVRGGRWPPLFLAIALSSSSSSGSALPAEPGPPAEDWLAFAEGASGVAGGVGRIRGVPLEFVPDLVRADEDERHAAASRRAAAVLPAERLAARGRAWSDLGLGDTGAPRRLYERLAEDLGPIAYDPSSRRVLVAPGRLAGTDSAPDGEDDPIDSLLLAAGVRPDEPVLAHVLVHALDRSRTGRDYLSKTTDETLAAAAWVEGEANLVAILYLFDGLGVGGQVVERRLDPGSVLGGSLLPSGLDRLPGAVGALLDFVYRDGFDQASAAFASGGWGTVDRAAASRRTTRDVLHRDRPASPAASTAEAPAPLPGFVLKDSDSLGEQGIVTLVSLGTGKDNLGLMAGDGWIGDLLCRFESAEDGSSPGYTVWSIRLRGEQDAEEMEYGLRRSLESRFPGREIETPSPGSSRIAIDGRAHVLERKGSDVRLWIVPEALEGRAGVPGRTTVPKRTNTKQK